MTEKLQMICIYTSYSEGGSSSEKCCCRSAGSVVTALQFGPVNQSQKSNTKKLIHIAIPSATVHYLSYFCLTFANHLRIIKDSAKYCSVTLLFIHR